jgi:hypothetical protein
MNKEKLIAQFIKRNLSFGVNDNGEVYLTKLYSHLIGDHVGDHYGHHAGDHIGDHIGDHVGDHIGETK